jgi:hypothetical protein
MPGSAGVRATIRRPRTSATGSFMGYAFGCRPETQGVAAGPRDLTSWGPLLFPTYNWQTGYIFAGQGASFELTWHLGRD